MWFAFDEVGGFRGCASTAWALFFRLLLACALVAFREFDTGEPRQLSLDCSGFITCNALRAARPNLLL